MGPDPVRHAAQPCNLHDGTEVLWPIAQENHSEINMGTAGILRVFLTNALPIHYLSRDGTILAIIFLSSPFRKLPEEDRTNTINMMKTFTFANTAASGLFFALASLCSAQVDLLFDRGLPNANLNNTAGVNRSNVVWAAASASYSVGDDFTLPGHESYTVTKIRVWSLDEAGLMLWGGPDKKSIALLSQDYTSSPVFYETLPPQIYQNSQSGFSQIYQIDFTVNLTIKGGKLYDFFLDGLSYNPYLHSSNAALSGSSPQQGADNVLLFLGPEGDIFGYRTSQRASATSPPAWNKDSDANVQVFGFSEKKKPKPVK